MHNIFLSKERSSVRYRVDVEYLGNKFHGWQKQKDFITVQGILEEILSSLLKTNIVIYGASRTDAGVHAMQQVCHFDIEVAETKISSLYSVRRSCNFFLKQAGHDIAVLSIEPVDPNFHARFSVKSKLYLYKIINRSSPSVILANHSWHISSPLNYVAIDIAMKHLVGTHDFSAFRDSECQGKSPIKTLDSITLFGHNQLPAPSSIAGPDINSNDIQSLCSANTLNGEINIYFLGRSFLHHMVRNLVGTLVYVGLGKIAPQEIPNILASRNRTRAGPTAPAHGLYLKRITY